MMKNCPCSCDEKPGEDGRDRLLELDHDRCGCPSPSSESTGAAGLTALTRSGGRYRSQPSASRSRPRPGQSSLRPLTGAWFGGVPASCADLHRQGELVRRELPGLRQVALHGAVPDLQDAGLHLHQLVEDQRRRRGGRQGQQVRVEVRRVGRVGHDQGAAGLRLLASVLALRQDAGRFSLRLRRRRRRSSSSPPPQAARNAAPSAVARPQPASSALIRACRELCPSNSCPLLCSFRQSLRFIDS